MLQAISPFLTMFSIATSICSVSKCGILWLGVNLSQTSPGLYVSAVQFFFKTLWKKEKLLVTSNFSFSHSVYYPFRELSAIFIKFEIVVCKLFHFGGAKNLSFGKGLTLFEMHNYFRLIQTEKVCRRQF